MYHADAIPMAEIPEGFQRRAEPNPSDVAGPAEPARPLEVNSLSGCQQYLWYLCSAAVAEETAIGLDENDKTVEARVHYIECVSQLAAAISALDGMACAYAHKYRQLLHDHRRQLLRRIENLQSPPDQPLRRVPVEYHIQPLQVCIDLTEHEHSTGYLGSGSMSRGCLGETGSSSDDVKSVQPVEVLDALRSASAASCCIGGGVLVLGRPVNATTSLTPGEADTEKLVNEGSDDAEQQDETEQQDSDEDDHAAWNEFDEEKSKQLYPIGTLMREDDDAGGAEPCVSQGERSGGSNPAADAEPCVSQPDQVKEGARTGAVPCVSTTVKEGARKGRRRAAAGSRQGCQHWTCPDPYTLPHATATFGHQVQQLFEGSVPSREVVCAASEVTVDGLNLLSRNMLDVSSLAGKEIRKAGGHMMQVAEDTGSQVMQFCGATALSGLARRSDATSAGGNRPLRLASTVMAGQRHPSSSRIDVSELGEFFPVGPDSAELLPSLPNSP